MSGRNGNGGQRRGRGPGAGGDFVGARGAGSLGCGGLMGAGGACLCIRCGHRLPHRRGVPCLQERCPECGAALVREGSIHHQEVVSRRDNAADAKNEG